MRRRGGEKEQRGGKGGKSEEEGKGGRSEEEGEGEIEEERWKRVSNISLARPTPPRSVSLSTYTS